MKYNFKQFDTDFPNDDACLEFIFALMLERAGEQLSEAS